MKEPVYLDLVKKFYENAWIDDSLSWVKSTVGGKDLYITQEIISEAFDIPTTEKKINGEDWISEVHTTTERVMKRVVEEVLNLKGKEKEQVKSIEKEIPRKKRSFRSPTRKSPRLAIDKEASEPPSTQLTPLNFVIKSPTKEKTPTKSPKGDS